MKDHTTLQQALEQGLVWVDSSHGTMGSCYVGIPTDPQYSDGDRVCFGIVGDEDSVEKYLSEYPTPDLW